MPNGVVRNGRNQARSGRKQIRNLSQSISKKGVDSLRNIFIQKKFHAAMIRVLDSLYAAKASAAKICSLLSCGKSARRSSYVIPEARKPKISETDILVPEMHGFPNLISGSIAIKSCQLFIKTKVKNRVLSSFTFKSRPGLKKGIRMILDSKHGFFFS